MSFRLCILQNLLMESETRCTLERESQSVLNPFLMLTWMLNRSADPCVNRRFHTHILTLLLSACLPLEAWFVFLWSLGPVQAGPRLPRMCNARVQSVIRQTPAPLGHLPIFPLISCSFPLFPLPIWNQLTPHSAPPIQNWTGICFHWRDLELLQLLGGLFYTSSVSKSFQIIWSSLLHS